MSDTHASLFPFRRPPSEDAAFQRKIWESRCPELLAQADRLCDEIDRLMPVYEAASDLCDDPFGSLDPRKFYALRESFYPTRDE